MNVARGGDVPDGRMKQFKENEIYAVGGYKIRVTQEEMPDGSPIQDTQWTVEESGENTRQVAAASFHRTDLDILSDMQKLAKENPDTVG